MDIINGKVGIYAEARKKWRRRLRKYKPVKGNPPYPSLTRAKQNKEKGNK
jgi:hypothetical protein